MPDENQEAAPATAPEATQEVVTDPTPEPEASPEPQTEQNVPYDRFDEVNQRNIRLEAQNEILRQGEYARNPQAAGQQVQQPPSHIFDEQTDRGVQELINRGRQEDQQRIGGLEAQLIVKTMENKYPDWHDHEEGVFNRLQQTGLDKVKLGGVAEMTQLAETLFLAEKASKGVFAKEAQKKTEELQQNKAAAAIPTRATERQPEAAKPWDEMTVEQREEYSANLKHS